MQLSVVILNYNVRYFLELCIKSVQNAITDLDAEIIVIDNNSPDDSCQMVKRLFPEVVLIENDENVGFSKANNQAVAHAKGTYVCILNPDTVVAEDTFVQLIDFAQRTTNLGAIGCQLIDGTGQYLPESKRNIPIVKVAAQKMLGKVDKYYNNEVAINDIGKTDVLVGAFMFMTKNVYDAVGGFDEDYFMYGEDIDLSYKLIKAGFDNYYYGQSTIIHYKGESTLKDKSYARRFYGAMQLFYKKHFSHNVFFDVAVWMGLKIAFLLRQAPKKYKPTVQRYVFLSDQIHPKLPRVLIKDITLGTVNDSFEPFTEVIFDAHVHSYKEIIKTLKSLGNVKHLSFKILPENSDFILGSDDSINRGEVILLNDNN